MAYQMVVTIFLIIEAKTIKIGQKMKWFDVCVSGMFLLVPTS